MRGCGKGRRARAPQWEALWFVCWARPWLTCAGTVRAGFAAAGRPDEARKENTAVCPDYELSEEQRWLEGNVLRGSIMRPRAEAISLLPERERGLCGAPQPLRRQQCSCRLDPGPEDNGLLGLTARPGPCSATCEGPGKAQSVPGEPPSPSPLALPAGFLAGLEVRPRAFGGRHGLSGSRAALLWASLAPGTRRSPALAAACRPQPPAPRRSPPAGLFHSSSSGLHAWRPPSRAPRRCPEARHRLGL